MSRKIPKCVEMKRRGAERVYKLISGMSRQEELEFWQKQSEKLRDQQEAALARRKAS